MAIRSSQSPLTARLPLTHTSDLLNLHEFDHLRYYATQTRKFLNVPLSAPLHFLRRSTYGLLTSRYSSISYHYSSETAISIGLANPRVETASI